MDSALVCVGLFVVFAASWWQLRKMKSHKVELEQRIEDLLVISDSLNRTQGRRARRIAMRGASIGEVLRTMPGLDPEPR